MLTKIAVFVSGGGTNLEALLKAQEAQSIPHGEIVLVIADKPGVYALTRAANHGVESCVIARKDYENRAAYEAELEAKLEEYRIDLIVLAGYLQILSADFTKKHAGRIVNIHPSLIPKHCGAGYYGLRVHESVLAAGETLTGATVHLVNEIPDGGEILSQKQVQVLPNDTPEVLQRRVMEEAEWIILPQCVAELASRISRKKEEEKDK